MVNHEHVWELVWMVPKDDDVPRYYWRCMDKNCKLLKTPHDLAA